MTSRYSKWLALGTLLVPLIASGYDFEPTPGEFMAWPAYCKARYVETNVGQRSEFADKVSDAERHAQQARLGRDTFIHVHHYCAGQAWLSRARIETDPREKHHMLMRALDEYSYAHRSMPKGGPLYPSTVTGLARIAQERGDIPGAESYLKQAMEANPADPRPYLAYASLYRDTKRLAAARDILEQGLEATNNIPIDLHYTLGLICLELKDNDCALEHARTAYAGGYPLPGLMHRLKRADVWTD